MAKPPYFRLYVESFLVGTMLFTDQQVGVYMRLLLHQWDNEFISKRKFAKFTHGLKEDEVEEVREKFLWVDAGYQNKRLQVTRLELEEYLERQSKYGKKGADKRWGTHSDPIGDPIGEPNAEPIATPLATPIASKSKSKSKAKAKDKTKLREEKRDVSFPTEKSQVAFDLFWTHFPGRGGKKRGKHRAITKFLELTDEEQMDCGLAAMNFAKSELAQEGIGIMDPHRFIWSTLNQEAEWKHWIEPEVRVIPRKKQTQFENSSDANLRVRDSVVEKIKSHFADMEGKEHGEESRVLVEADGHVDATGSESGVHDAGTSDADLPGQIEPDPRGGVAADP